MLKLFIVGLLLLLVQHIDHTSAQLKIELKNTTILTLDIIPRLTSEIGEREKYQPFSEQSVNRVQALVRNLSRDEPRGKIGDKCDLSEWQGYIQPIILSTLRGDFTKVDKAYRTLAYRVIDEDETVLQRICLSRTYGLQCNRTQQCECLTTTGIQYVPCQPEDDSGSGAIVSGQGLLFISVGLFVVKRSITLD